MAHAAIGAADGSLLPSVLALAGFTMLLQLAAFVAMRRDEGETYG